MNVPINGLRLLVVETSILIVTTILAFLYLRFGPPPAWPRWCERILAKSWRPVLLVIAIALVGRALLLPWVSIPHPHINDEYSYLLMGDTFAHLRLTNPTPASWQHFETFHVNLTPTYHSKYPVAQGLVLAFGEFVFHQPWVGIYLTTALLCGGICWTLEAFVPPAWALIGALLATVKLAFFSYWMNSFWGGSVAALGGALALGSVVRVFDARTAKRSIPWLAALFAFSLLILATSRPYEGLGFALPLMLYFVYKLMRDSMHELRFGPIAIPVLIIGIVGLGLMAYYNHRTTGNALVMPYALNERTYASLPLFLGEHVNVSSPARDPVFARYYAVEAQEHRLDETHSSGGLLAFEAQRFGMNWLFYVSVALSLPVVVGFLASIRERRSRILIAITVTTAVAVALCSFTQVHYFSPATVVVFAFASIGLSHLWSQEANLERAFAIAVCITVVAVSLLRQTASSAMNGEFAFADTRKLVARQLEHQPAKHLVLVFYDFDHHYPGNELVHNGADFSSQKILWARSKGFPYDQELCRYYPDRMFWNITTDDTSYSLAPSDLCKISRQIPEKGP